MEYKGWRVKKLNARERRRLHEGYVKMCEALAKDEEERRARRRVVPHMLINGCTPTAGLDSI